MQEQIIEALRRGDAASALAAARARASAAPEDPQAQRLLSLTLRASGDATAALAAIERAISLAPQDARLHLEHAELLLGARDVDGAGRALDATVNANPNELGAYILQAQLAMGNNDLEEAGRLARLAERVEPDHPAVQSLRGTLEMRRGSVDGAMGLLQAAIQRAPGDPMTLHALGIAYMAKGTFAFAEQAFRKLLERTPGAGMVRLLIAEAQLRQNRPGDAADELLALVADPALRTPDLCRHAGELQLVAGRADRAVPLLREALAAAPGDPRVLRPLIEAWHRLGDLEDARRTLEEALATMTGSDDLWRARVAIEWSHPQEALAVAARWREQRPESIEAIEAEVTLFERLGRNEDADAAARQVLERDPDNMRAGIRLIDSLLVTNPAEAVPRLESMLGRASTPADRGVLAAWLGLAYHRTSDFKAALESWEQRNADQASERVPLPVAAPSPEGWPDSAPLVTGMPPTIFLAGFPGSPVDRVGEILAAVAPAFRSDRFSAKPPADLLQSVTTPARIASGELTPGQVVDSWRAAFPSRRVQGPMIDWLLWWDNAYARVLRAALPAATLVLVMRDPRDMLVNWLAFGSQTPFGLTSAEAGAEWLAAALTQAAILHEENLVPHRLLRLDDEAKDVAAMAERLGEALGASIPELPANFLQSPSFPSGTWRDYADLLAGPFAALVPVARRFGYPDA